MKIRTTFNAVTVELDGAQFFFKPLMLAARMEISALVVDMEKSENFHDMSADSRHTMHKTLTDHLTGWEGVIDERGAPVTFDPALIQGFTPSQAISLFWSLFNAAYITDEQRKNLATQLELAGQAPDSIAENAEQKEPIPAESPASLNTGTAAAS